MNVIPTVGIPLQLRDHGISIDHRLIQRLCLSALYHDCICILNVGVISLSTGLTPFVCNLICAIGVIWRFGIGQSCKLSDRLEHCDVRTARRTDSAHRHPGADRGNLSIAKWQDKSNVQAEALTDCLDAVSKDKIVPKGEKHLFQKKNCALTRKSCTRRKSGLETEYTMCLVFQTEALAGNASNARQQTRSQSRTSSVGGTCQTYFGLDR